MRQCRSYFIFRSKGFTLIEIMVVIAIIGILAGIAIPSYVRSKREAQVTACIENLRCIATAVQTWQIRNGPLVVNQRINVTVEQLVDMGYLGKAPVCPAVGQCSYTIGYKRIVNEDRCVVFCNSVKFRNYNGNHNGTGFYQDGPGLDINTNRIWDSQRWSGNGPIIPI